MQVAASFCSFNSILMASIYFLWRFSGVRRNLKRKNKVDNEL